MCVYNTNSDSLDDTLDVGSFDGRSVEILVHFSKRVVQHCQLLEQWLPAITASFPIFSDLVMEHKT